MLHRGGLAWLRDEELFAENSKDPEHIREVLTILDEDVQYYYQRCRELETDGSSMAHELSVAHKLIEDLTRPARQSSEVRETTEQPRSGFTDSSTKPIKIPDHRSSPTAKNLPSKPG